MISRRTILVTVVALVLFCVSAYAGYAYRGKRSITQQFDQAGWCCMMQQRRCVVAQSEEGCQTSGGASYSWDRDSCENACVPAVRRKTAPSKLPKTTP